MNKRVHLKLSVLELSGILMYEFWYDDVKQEYGETVRIVLYGYRFIVYIKTDDIYNDVAEDVETRFDTSNYEIEYNSIDRPLPTGKNKKVIGLMKDELGRKIMAKFVGLRAKIYSYLIDDDSEDKKAISTRKFVIKRKLKFENYKICLEATQLENKINYIEKIKLI